MMKLDSDRLLDLERLLSTEVDQQKILGCSVEIGNVNGTLYRSCFGNIDEDSMVCLCSMTKPITSVVVQKLFERGILSPEDEVGDFLPSFKKIQVMENGSLVDPVCPVKVKNLLDMTSGLIFPDPIYENKLAVSALKDVYEKILAEFRSGTKISYADACDRLAAAPLAFQPGTQWAYGYSADILGGVAEKASGVAYDKLVKKLVFDPLKMEHTKYILTKEEMKHVPDILISKDNKMVVIPGTKTISPEDNPLDKAPYVTSSGGGWAPEIGRGLYSTIHDYGRFARMLLNGGELDGERVLSGETVKMYSVNHLTEGQRACMWDDLLKGYGYGNLMRVMLYPEEIHSNGNIGEFGWDGFLGTYFFVDPKAGIYLVYFMQGVPDFKVRGKIRHIVYAAVDGNE